METKKWKNTVEMSETEELTFTEVDKSQKKDEEAHKPEDVELKRRQRKIYYEGMKAMVLALLKFLASHGLVYGFLSRFSSIHGFGALLILVYFFLDAIISIRDIIRKGMYSEFDSRSNFRSRGTFLCLVANFLAFFAYDYMQGKRGLWIGLWLGLIGGCLIYIGELLIVLKFFKIMHQLNGQQQ